MRESDSGTFSALREALAEHNISTGELNTLITLGNAEAIALAVQEGIGVGFISQMVIDRLCSGRVAKVPASAALNISRKIYIGQNRRRPATGAQAAFWSFLTEFNAEQLELSSWRLNRGCSNRTQWKRPFEAVNEKTSKAKSAHIQRPARRSPGLGALHGLFGSRPGSGCLRQARSRSFRTEGTATPATPLPLQTPLFKLSRRKLAPNATPTSRLPGWTARTPRLTPTRSSSRAGIRWASPVSAWSAHYRLRCHNR